MKFYPNTYVHEIKLSAAQRGWICEIWFGHETHRQCTYEHSTAAGYGPEMWLGPVGAFLSIVSVAINCAMLARRSRQVPGPWNNEDGGITQRAADGLVGWLEKLPDRIARHNHKVSGKHARR